MSMLPKNVRQIGQIEGNKRIYIEDYVMTYARKMEGMAVLLGKEEAIEGKNVFFISGAVTIKNTIFGYPTTLTNEDWSNIYEDVKKYFLDYEIAGWMLARRNVVLEIDEEIRNIHEENFKGNNKILFLFDKGEGEEAFYLSDSQGDLKKQRGYYIYYEKNEPMQNYMVEKSDGEKVEEFTQDDAMEKVREIVTAKEAPQPKDRKMMNLMYGASSILAAVVLVIGATTLDNYDKMKNMEQTLNTISGNLEGNMSEDDSFSVEVETVTGNTQLAEAEDEKGKEIDINKNIIGAEQEENQEDNQGDVREQENPEEADNKEGKEEGISEEEKQPEESDEKEADKTGENDKKEESGKSENQEVSEASAAAKNKYTVKEGDTLASISLKFYKSFSYIEVIKELNGIEDGDLIFADQILLLP